MKEVLIQIPGKKFWDPAEIRSLDLLTTSQPLLPLSYWTKVAVECT